MIRLANYHTHPEHKDYTVLAFEKAIDEDEKIIMFGIKSTLFEKAQKINADSYAKYKKAFIPDNTLRYSLLGIFFILITLAIVGYIKSNY
jgi:hypothetical protein